MSNTLSMPTLVLNKGYTPVRISTVEKVITGLAKGVLSVMDNENGILYDWKGWAELPVIGEQKFLTTGKNRKTGEQMHIRVPSIVVLARYNKLPIFDVKLNMQNLYYRDGGRCQYTGRKLSMKEATKDHVLPVSRGGKDTWENLVLCCPEINKKKADKTPAEMGWKLLKTPRKPKWSPMYAALCGVKRIPDEWKDYLGGVPGIESLVGVVEE